MVREIVALLAQQLQIEAELLLDMPWETRAAALDSGEIDVGWICGAPYVQKVDSRMRIELLAAPVPVGERYAGQPVYFSDVITRADSRFDTFESLNGARFAFNEPGSHSGFHVVRYTQAQRKLGAHFFGSTVFSGGHAFSLAKVLANDVDAAAIDSTVLETLLRENPAYAKGIKIIDSLGPSPRPPWIIRKEVPVPLRAEIRKCLMTLHEHPAGRAILHTGHTERFAGVTDHDYDPIRQMLRLTERRFASIQPTRQE
jgi:phosphonate transport system substrate-binding protein